jgi:hypothetical protein
LGRRAWFKEKFGLEWVGGPPQKVDQMIADAIRESRRDLDAGALGCSSGEAFVWLKDRVDPIPEHIKAFNPQPTETTEREPRG